MKLLWKLFYVWAGSWLCWGVCIVETESGLKCWNWQLWRQHFTSIQFIAIAIWRHIIAIQNSMAAGKLAKTYKCKIFAALVGLF